MLPLDTSPVFCPEAADFSFLHPLKPTLLFTAFWRFAAERQRGFWRRVQGLPPPWTVDPVLAAYKFTNAYRASDRVSQHLIRLVIYEGPQLPRELFFRTLLFKLFNRVETWGLLQRNAGPLAFIRLLQERQRECFAAVGVTFPALPGRELQLIDVQNLFCEVDKYARVAYPQFATADNRQRIKHCFQPSATMPPLRYPPKWGING